MTYDPHDLVAANPQGNVNAAMGHSPNLLGGPTSPSPAGLQPSLQGVKIPDEDLTPEQRQHRASRLATLREMQKMLFNERNEENVPQLDNPQGANQGSSCPLSNMPPVSAPSMEWHKLQYLEGKNKVRNLFCV